MENQNKNPFEIPAQQAAPNALDSQPAKVIQEVADNLVAEQAAAAQADGEVAFKDTSLNIKPNEDGSAEVMSEESLNTVREDIEHNPLAPMLPLESTPEEQSETVLAKDLEANYPAPETSESVEASTEPVVAASETLGAAAVSESVTTEVPATEAQPEAKQDAEVTTEAPQTELETTEESAPIPVEAKVVDVAKTKTGLKAKLAHLISGRKN